MSEMWAELLLGGQAKEVSELLTMSPWVSSYTPGLVLEEPNSSNATTLLSCAWLALHLPGASSHPGDNDFMILLSRRIQLFTRPGVLQTTLVSVFCSMEVCVGQERISSRTMSAPDGSAVLWFLLLWNVIQIVLSSRLPGGRWANHMVLRTP